MGRHSSSACARFGPMGCCLDAACFCSGAALVYGLDRRQAAADQQSWAACQTQALHLCMQAGQDLTAVAFEEAGLQCAVGTSQGLVGVFDLRASKPLAVKDHMYSDAIRSIQYHHLPGDSGDLTCLSWQLEL